MKQFEKDAVDYALKRFKNWAEICIAKDAYIEACHASVNDPQAYTKMHLEVEVELKNGSNQLTDHGYIQYLKDNK
jgi:hypothetical protein